MIDPPPFKEKVALYLNENPDFFNDYPELLTKIKSIDLEDLPLSPPHALSIADQNVQQVQDVREHINSKLDWFIELARSNERIHEHLYEIERMALTSTELLPMVSQLRSEIIHHFDIQHVIVYLADGCDPFVEKNLKTRYPETIDGALRFVEQPVLQSWFPEGVCPILRGDVDKDSQVFTTQRIKHLVKSEALLPVVIRGNLVGCVALGCEESYHFYEELSTGFITRMASKIAIAIDNILLMEEFKQRALIDPLTDHYNRFYLMPVLVREFDRAKRSQKKLSSIMMCIDYLENLSHTDGEPETNAVLRETGAILNHCCRTMDIVIRYDESKFFVLLPESSNGETMEISDRIRKTVERTAFPVSANGGRLTASLGLATYPSVMVNSHQDLVQAAFNSLSKAKAKGGNRAVLA